MNACFRHSHIPVFYNASTCPICSSSSNWITNRKQPGAAPTNEAAKRAAELTNAEADIVDTTENAVHCPQTRALIKLIQRVSDVAEAWSASHINNEPPTSEMLADTRALILPKPKSEKEIFIEFFTELFSGLTFSKQDAENIVTALAKRGVGITSITGKS